MTNSQPIPWKYLAKTLQKYSPFWLGITLLFACLGIAVALFSPDRWEANKPLLVRDEASGSVERLGKFSSQTELIAAQETLVEMVRNHDVVKAALERLEPPQDFDGARWPSEEVIESVAQDAVNLRAPSTSEFGKTEVVYLTARAETPQRAEQLCAAMFEALSAHLRHVRELRADSVVAELLQSRDLASDHLAEATDALRELEKSLGIDLGELRGLSEAISGESNSTRVLTELQRDLRAAEQELRKVESLRKLLVRAYEDPQQLAVSDGSILTSQPTLQRLTAGLIDAQLEASRLSGSLTPDHPRMISARLGTETIREELRSEIANVLLAMQPVLELAQEKCQRLVNKQNDLQEKLTKLASIRTEYSRRVNEVKNRTELLSQAEAALAEAEASHTSATTTSLIAALGPARAGEKPVGVGGAVVTVGATLAGLMLGLGGVFLVAPTPTGTSAGFGRRWSDRLTGRRASDAGNPPTNDRPLPFPDRRAASNFVAPGAVPALETPALDRGTGESHGDEIAELAEINTEPESEFPTVAEAPTPTPAPAPTELVGNFVSPRYSAHVQTTDETIRPAESAAEPPGSEQPIVEVESAVESAVDSVNLSHFGSLPRIDQRSDLADSHDIDDVPPTNDAGDEAKLDAEGDGQNEQTPQPEDAGEPAAELTSEEPEEVQPELTNEVQPQVKQDHPAEQATIVWHAPLEAVADLTEHEPSVPTADEAEDRQQPESEHVRLSQSQARTELVEHLQQVGWNLDIPLPFEDVEPEPPSQPTDKR